MNIPMHAGHPLVVHLPLIAFFVAGGFDLVDAWSAAPRFRRAATVLWWAALAGAAAAIAQAPAAWRNRRRLTGWVMFGRSGSRVLRSSVRRYCGAGFQRAFVFGRAAFGLRATRAACPTLGCGVEIRQSTISLAVGGNASALGVCIAKKQARNPLQAKRKPSEPPSISYGGAREEGSWNAIPSGILRPGR